MQALYCRVRVRRGGTQDWYLVSVQRLFDVVALMGFILAAMVTGCIPAVAVLVSAVPGFCLVLSAGMVVAFVEAPRPQEQDPLRSGAFVPAPDAVQSPLPAEVD